MKSIMTKVVCAACLALAATVRGADCSFLKKGDIWLLCGDSITSTDTYRQLLQSFADHCYPDAGIRIANRGVWGQLSREAEKLKIAIKPSVVSIMLGMNDVIHRDFGEQADYSAIRRKYRETIVKQVRTWKGKGAEVILWTPTLTDEREGNFFGLYNSKPGLVELGEEVRAIAREEGCRLIDMQNEFEAAQRVLAVNRCLRPDGVHPFGWGQYVIARILMHHLRFAAPLAEEARGWCAEAPADLADPVTVESVRKFCDAPAEGLAFDFRATRPFSAKVTWSVGGERGTETLALGCEPVRWKLPATAQALSLKAGEFSRVVLTVEGCGAPRLFVADLARTLVYDMRGGVATGEIRTDAPRAEGPLVATWRLEEHGHELWLTGRVYERHWPKQQRSLWSNAFQQNGLQLLWDFRPASRFADLMTDRDAHTMLMSVIRDPYFSVVPLAWLNRSIQLCTSVAAQPTEDGWTWTMGFRGYRNDFTEFDVSKLDMFGMHFNVATTDDKGAIRRYATMEYVGLTPFNESRFNQSMIFDRKGVLKGPETTVVKVFGFNDYREFAKN